ncbi:MAG: hypothetical protein JW953_09315 [Anaerolineae bacterium]|nr:hypothetical protein [Anaerolineae bacterium]
MTRQRAVLLTILLIAFFLRVWQLPILPPGLWYDEAYNAMDALWTVKSGHYPLFFVGNNGREPMWPYLLLLSTTLFGHTPLAVRWVGAMAGFLTIPIMYRFAYFLLRPFAQNKRQRYWLALAASAWLAISWWHLLNSRAGFRPVLLPPLLMLSLYFWMAGIRYQRSRVREHVSRSAYLFSRNPFLNFILAGLLLGLSQYTYLPARLAPLIWGGFAIFETVQILWAIRPNKNHKIRKTKDKKRLTRLWLGLFVTGLVAALVFLPLGLFFFNHPETFSSRTGDVVFVPQNLGQITSHLLQSVSLFWGAGHQLYRHHFPGRAMLGWLEIPFFWVGLLALLRRSQLRRPETKLILLGLLIMWIPACLASPPVHGLRPIGLLPFYYLVVTLGLYYVSRIIYHRLRPTPYSPKLYPAYLLPFAAAIFISLNSLLNTYDYFQRWANHPETYKEYNGPLVEVTRHLLELSQTTDVIIPFHLYVHPTTRYLLWPAFSEKAGPPPPSNRPVEMLLIPNTFQLLYVGNIPTSPAMVLLTRDTAGQGVVYVSRPPRANEQLAINEALAAKQNQLKPFQDKLGRAIVQFLPLSRPSPLTSLLSPLFNPAPLRVIDLNWANVARLKGYDVTPEVARPGQPLTINLYWQSLTEATFEHRLFLQILNGAGRPINQAESDAFREDMYRWRPNGLLTTQHTLWLGPDTPPGPYLLRLGFFDELSGRRLPLQTSADAAPLEQVQLGLFYVSPDGTDPRRPVTPLSANFADSIELIGITIPPSFLPSSFLPVTLHWHTLSPTAKPYTVFLQLLNQQGEVVGSWDQQPFNGLYPTPLWSPGEIIADTLPLPLPGELAPGRYRLITGFYDFETGQRLPVVNGGDFVELTEFVVD